MDRIHIVRAQDWSLELLVEGDIPSLQKLMEHCGDYYEMVTGLPPGPSEAFSTFMAAPDGYDYNEKFLAGVFDANGHIIGVVDAIPDYPVASEWRLGLLLLDPDRRDQGWGAKVYQAFENWAVARGAHAVSLSVAEQNQRAIAFYRQQGFSDTGERRELKSFSHRTLFQIMKKQIENEASRPFGLTSWES